MPRDDGGAAGESAAAGLTVEATTPRDEASAVERAAVIEVVFSAPLDPKTVTSDTFRVVGPTGAVSGKLSVSGAKATFTPSVAWSLLADYTVELASTIRSEHSVQLSDTYRFAFQTRDGVFRKPERLTTMKPINLQVVGSRAGHVGVVWTEDVKPASTFVAMFDPQSTKWGKATAIASDGQNDYNFATMSINDSGRAFAIAGSNKLVWNRFGAGTWRTAQSFAGHSHTGFCAIADDGTAMAIWQDYVENESVVFAQSLSAEDKWSAVQTLRSGARTISIKRFGSGFLAFHEFESEHAVYSNSYNPKLGWSPATFVASLANSFGQGIATSETAALLVGMDANNMATAALFNGKSWTSETLALVSGGIRAAVGDGGHVAAWVTQDTAYASRYDLKLGWQPPAKLGAITTGWSGPGLEIDASGNALAAWPEGSNVTWRRSPHSGAGWSDPLPIKDQDPFEAVYSAGNSSSGEVVLVWTNPLGIWATRFE